MPLVHLVDTSTTRPVPLVKQQKTQENTCARVSFLLKMQAEACNFIKKETLVKVLSCEFCKISKNTFFTEHLRTTVSFTIFALA